MVALERAGIPVERYVAYEINKHAMKVSQKNYPHIEQMGDVTLADFTQHKSFDLLIGGSPCQGFSFAGKQLNFEDPRSKLFFEFVRALNEVKPKFFLLENVKMKTEFQDVISEYLGVQPIEINSSLLSAQRRKRLYWTNIPEITEPEDKGILLKDIIHETTDSSGFDLEKYKLSQDKSLQILNAEVEKGKIVYNHDRGTYLIHGKEVALGDETEQYLFGCITPNRIKKRQNGQRFNDGEKFYTLTAQDQHGILTNGYIRRLTPTECERLQTLDDNYTEGILETLRYRCLGDAWTADVIAHILGGLNNGK